VAFATSSLVVSGRSSGIHQSATRNGADDSRVVEIRAYTLKPGMREAFHELFVRESLPMSSVDRAKPAICRHFKTGHLSTLQNRPFPVSGIEAD